MRAAHALDTTIILSSHYASQGPWDDILHEERHLS